MRAGLVSLDVPTCKRSLQPVLQLLQLTQFPNEITIILDMG